MNIIYIPFRFVRMCAVLCIACLHGLSVNGQTDDEFWFVIPEITADHNDRPIQMRFNTFEQASEVRISMPANPTFNPILVSIPPFSLELVDLTPYIDELETKPENTILRNGLLIEASTCITAYYEIDAWNNPDIFILKGRNALGKSFLVPFQSQWSNDVFPTAARSGFDLVATEDNTLVVVTPSMEAVGHQARRPFEIRLNRGQTYSVVAESNRRDQKLAGTLVQSDKPIAITIKDDSQLNVDGGTCSDVGGDQLIPISLTGTQYIIPRGRLNTADRVALLATEDLTDIFLNGNSVADYSLDAAEQVQLTLTEDVVYIESSKPIYVLHASGVNCEIGHAIVPPLQCTGSKEISSARVDNGQFFMFIIVPSGHEQNFNVTGVDYSISPANFIEVPGNGNYKVARISANFFPLDVPFRVSNSSSGFHFGILNGDTGARYGYFSDFGSLQVSVSDEVICQGDLVDVSIKSTYSSLDWTPAIDEPGDFFSLSPLETTTYRLIASDTEMCRDTATFTISVNPSHALFDTIYACQNERITLGNREITASGDYAVNLLTRDNCDSTLYYHVQLLDTLMSREVKTLCPGESVVLFGNLEVSDPGTYFNSYTSSSGCDSLHVIELMLDSELYFSDTVYLCGNETIEVFGNAVNQPGTFVQSYSSSRPCDSVQTITVLPASTYDFLDTIYMCKGASVEIHGENISASGEYPRLFNSVQGCDSMHAYVVIEDDPGTYLNWPDQLTMNFGKPVTWKISNSRMNIDTLIWSTLLGIQCTQCIEWKFDPFETTTYDVTIYTRGGCVITRQFTVEVIQEKPVYFPNTFSPNGDGINDFFTASTPELNSVIDWLDIYDRWGNRVARTESFAPNQNQMGWDGMFGDQPALPGVYIYQAQLTFSDGKVFQYNGDITLIR